MGQQSSRQPKSAPSARETNHRACLTRPHREGRGGASIFLNTEHTENTKNHPAHLDGTDAVSRQQISRNLHTLIANLKTLRFCVPHRASLTRPLGRVGEGPLPLGRAGEGPPLIFLNTEDTELTENHPEHFDNTDAASRQLMTRNLHTRLISLLNSATLRALTYQRGHAIFFARRVAEFWEFLLLAKQESTWRGPSYGLGVNGGCARLLQPYLPVPGTKIKTL